MTTTSTSLIDALIKAQSEMLNPKRTTKAFNYKYAQLDEILDSVKPVLSKHGILMQQTTQYNKETGTSFVLTFFKKGNDIIESILPITCAKNKDLGDPQVLGSVITYLRRYQVLTMCGLAQQDDDGLAASISETKQEPVTKTHITDLKLLDNPGEFIVRFGKFRDKKLKDLDLAQLNSYVSYLSKSKDLKFEAIEFIKWAEAYIQSKTEQDSILDHIQTKPIKGTINGKLVEAPLPVDPPPDFNDEEHLPF